MIFAVKSKKREKINMKEGGSYMCRVSYFEEGKRLHSQTGTTVSQCKGWWHTGYY
jgi:hypothetical protein